MRNAWLAIRSVLLWTVTWIHFIPAALVVTVLGMVLSPRAVQPFLRAFCRTIVFLTGARLRVRRSPGSAVDGP